jgi:hypothetical protein
LQVPEDSEATLDVSRASGESSGPRLELTPYIADKQRDYVRLIVTVGLLLRLA